MEYRTSLTSMRVSSPGRGLSSVLLLASPKRPELKQRGSLSIAALLIRLAGVAMLAWIGWLHWVLWVAPTGGQGYQFIPTVGPFFLVDAIAGVVLAVVLLAWPRPLAGLVGAGFTASTILALLISLLFGLFGFKESISASYVVLALVVESVALVILLAWTVIAARALPSRR